MLTNSLRHAMRRLRRRTPQCRSAWFLRRLRRLRVRRAAGRRDFWASARPFRAGNPVWVSKGTQNDTPDREIYEGSFLKPDVIMSCNNQAFFEQMATRMNAPASVHALPPSLLEWKYVNRGAELWGLCRYLEKTSALAMMGNQHDPHATGISVEFGSDGSDAKAILLARSNLWEGWDANPELSGTKASQPSPGVWALSASDRSPTVALLFMAIARIRCIGFDGAKFVDLCRTRNRLC